MFLILGGSDSGTGKTRKYTTVCQTKAIKEEKKLQCVAVMSLQPETPETGKQLNFHLLSTEHGEVNERAVLIMYSAAERVRAMEREKNGSTG